MRAYGFRLLTKVHELFRHTTWRCSTEMFAIKFESRQKSRRILDVCLPTQILGGGHSQNCTHLITPVSWRVAWKSFARILPLAQKF